MTHIKFYLKDFESHLNTKQMNSTLDLVITPMKIIIYANITETSQSSLVSFIILVQYLRVKKSEPKFETLVSSKI